MREVPKLMKVAHDGLNIVARVLMAAFGFAVRTLCKSSLLGIDGGPEHG